jgi:hypothetical protein
VSEVVAVTKRTAVAIVVLASLVGISVVTGFRVFVPDRGNDCPPLGNGGAMRIAETGERAETREKARTLLRSVIGADSNVSAGGRGHLYGKEQIHRHIDGVDHYHFSPESGGDASVMGWVVTENGTVYRVVQGAC